MTDKYKLNTKKKTEVDFMVEFLEFLIEDSHDLAKCEAQALTITANVIVKLYKMTRNTIRKNSKPERQAQFDEDLDKFADQAGERLAKSIKDGIAVIKEHAVIRKKDDK